jgi:hypothetical protein
MSPSQSSEPGGGHSREVAESNVDAVPTDEPSLNTNLSNSAKREQVRQKVQSD